MDTIDIGLRQGRKLANMAYKDRLAFIAEGLPVIIASARDLVHSARDCPHARGRTILERHAAEEAAKALILMDVVRCPQSLVSHRIGCLMRSFYDHSARLLWAEACHWSAAHLAELQSYLDRDRRSHYLDGPAGADWIFPNNAIFERESLLYTDVAAHEDGGLFWSGPSADGSYAGLLTLSIDVANALKKVGATSAKGLEIVAGVWAAVRFELSKQTHDLRSLTDAMLHELDQAGLMASDVADEDIQTLYRRWQMPMYNADFSPLPISLAHLDRLRAAELRAMSGYL